LLKDQSESFQGTEREDVEREVAALKEALNGTDIEAIKDAGLTLDKIDHVSMVGG
jgi:molecular chaperone DnaK (HSP70)